MNWKYVGLRNSPGVRLGKWAVSTRNLSRGSRCVSRDLNPGTGRNEATLLTTRQRCSVKNTDRNGQRFHDGTISRKTSEISIEIPDYSDRYSNRVLFGYKL